jgi:hypothetical protein
MGNPGESWYTHLGYSGKKEPRERVVMAETYIQWLTWSDPSSSRITMVSAWTLIQQLARVLHTFCGYMAQDWWPADSSPPDPYSVLLYELPNDVRYTVDAPGLSVRVRVTWQLAPHHPPLAEWSHTFEGIPPFQARVDESSSKLQRFLLVEFDTPPQCTLEAWEQAFSAPTPDRWDALQKTRKFLTLHVGLGDQYKEWFPQDKALWQGLKLQKALRAVDHARRNSRLSSVREALVQVLEQALQHTSADAALRSVVEETLIELGARPLDWDPWRAVRHPEGLHFVDSVLPPDWEHQPLGWLPLWIEPEITIPDDTIFELVLRLLQWHMLESTLEINRFLDRYMKQFKYAFIEDERHLLQKGRVLGGGEGFAEILRTDAYPESAKGLHQYISRTLHGHRATAARREAKQSGQWLTMPARSDGLYTMLDAVRILAREAYKDHWTPPSRDWLDDRIKEGVLPVIRDAQGRKCLDENGLHCARTLVKGENIRRWVVEYYTNTLRKTARAANKYIQKHKACGESLEDITKGLLARRKQSTNMELDT